MKKILFIFIALFAFSVPAFAMSPRLNDGADLLDSTEEAEILNLLNDVSSKTGFDLVIVTTNSTNGKSVMEYADDYYDNNGYGENGLLFLIDMGGREWWISTSGEAINRFSDSTLDYIGEESSWYLSNGDYCQAFNTFIILSENHINGNVDYGDDYDDDYDYNDPFYDDFYYESEIEYDLGTTLVISLIAGFIIALIYVSSLKSKLTTVGAQKSASNYAINSSLQIAATRDNFLYKNVSRVPKARNNNSSRSGRSGGSSVHRASSGRSHGGRGGRF